MSTSAVTSPGTPPVRRPSSPVDALFRPDLTGTQKVLAFIIVATGVLLILFHLYTAYFAQLPSWAQRHFAVTVLLVIGYLLRPLGRKSWWSPLNHWFLIDLLFLAMSVVPFLAVLTDFERWTLGLPRLSTTEVVMGTAFVIAVLELTRRVIGWALVAIAVFFMVQNATAIYFPPPFFAPNVAWGHQITMIYSGEHGIFGIPMGVVTGYLVLFFLLAALLSRSVTGEVIINLAMSVVGRFSGGPAKVAVVGSALFGTVTGSCMADVMAVGSFTIPMMKKMGFSPVMAGAVEAAAATGAQFVPPVLGVVAFMMPAFLGVSYFTVVLASIIPAFLYYLGVFTQTHLEAKKLHIEGVPRDQLPRFWSALKPVWILAVPILAIFYFLFLGWGLARVALYGIVLMLVCAAISRREPRLSARSVLNAMHEAANMSVTAGIACASAGIIIGAFYTSGLGDKLSLAIVGLAGNSVWPALLLTAVVCIILGMGIPTPAIYITMVLITIPALIKLGVVPLAAHMFTFFMGVTSGLTPPVALTAFVAGSLANAPMMRTGLVAFRLSIIGFIVAFIFTVRPELLLVGQPAAIAYWVAMASLGSVSLSISFEGFLVDHLNWLGKLLFLVAGIACWWPYSIPLNVGGVILMALLVLVYGRFYRKILRTPHRAS